MTFRESTGDAELLVLVALIVVSVLVRGAA